MQTQLALFLRRLFTFIHSLVMRPQHLRLVVTIVVVCLVLAIVFFPVLTTLAGGLSGGGS